MRESIIFRGFEESDRLALEQVIRETWCYDRFCTPETADQFASVYLTSCLANQTFTQVALVDGVPSETIMGKNRVVHKCPFSLRLKKVKSIVKLLISKEGRRVSKIFGCVDGIDQELLNRYTTDYQVEPAFLQSAKHAGEKELERRCSKRLWSICALKRFTTSICLQIQAATMDFMNIRA